MLLLRTEVFLCLSILHSHAKNKPNLYKCTNTITKSRDLTHTELINPAPEAVK